MIALDFFTYTDAQWDAIKVVVQKALQHDADTVVLESTSMDGSKCDATLRTEIEGTARIHLVRDKRIRSLPTQMALRKRLTDLRDDTKRLRDGIKRLRPFRARHNDYSPDKDMEFASDAFFKKLLRNLEGIIVALGPPRRKTGSAASKNESRDLFWSDLLAIWCKIGETGAEAADFLIAVSVPVFNAMPRGARDAVPTREAVIQWLWRRSRRG